MSALRADGHWHFNCDKCSSHHECEEVETFLDALAEVHASGWTSQEVKKNDWEHYCPLHKDPADLMKAANKSSSRDAMKNFLRRGA